MANFIAKIDSRTCHSRLPLFQVAALCSLSALIMLKQLVTPGFFSVQPEDALNYTGMAEQFTNALREGVFFPIWMPMNFGGYGTPTFILYSPLAYYLIALIELFTGSIIVSMNLVKFAAFSIGGAGIFLLAREFHSDRTAFLTAAFYLLLPFHVFQIYLVESFASGVSLAWFPFIILFLARYHRSGRCRHLVYAGACYAGLILSYLIHAYMFVFVMTAFVVLISIADKKPATVLAIPAVLLLGGVLSAVHLLPFMLERQFLNTDVLITKGLINFHYHFSGTFLFPDMSKTLAPYNFWHVYHDIYVLHVTIFCCLLLLVMLAHKKDETMPSHGDNNNVARFFLIAALITILLQFGISYFIWDNVPYFKYIHFPKRWLNITSFSVVMASASLFKRFELQSKLSIAYILLMTLVYGVFVILDYRYIEIAKAFPESELLPSKGISSTLEHLPRGVNPDKIDYDGRRVVIVTSRGKANTTISSWTSAERVIETLAEEPLAVRVRTFNFPGWTAYLDGERTPIREEKGTKAILVDVPRGKHMLKLVFEDTPVRFYGKIISAVSLMSILAFMMFDLFKYRKAPLHD